MHEVLVNRLGGLSLPRKSVVRLTDRPDMTLDQGGQRTSRSRANNGKQLALQKKITSNKVRKSVISRVLKFQFLCRKA